MKLVKPQRLGLLKRSLLWGGRTLLSIGVVTAFPLAEPRRIMKEGEMWEAIAPALGDQVLDTGEPKARGEVLAFGHYFAPGGKPVLQHGVRLALGSVDKSIRVTGRREWATDAGGRVVPTAPEPLTSLPIEWKYAFGGKDFVPNPAGIGYWPVDTRSTDARYPLPFLEYPDNVVAHPDDIVPPAGFGPRDLMTPARQQHAGTYDRFWADNHAPGLPQDATLDLFQAAAIDQHLPGFIDGREAFAVENMHPDLPIQAGTLPGVRARAFVRRVGAPGTLEEVALATDTCIFFPAIGLGVLIHRGSLWVSAFDHPEIDLLLTAFEWQEHEPRTLGYYEKDLALRLAPEGAHLGLDYLSLSPKGWIEPPSEKAGWFKVLKPRPFAVPPSLQAKIDEAQAQLAKMVPAEQMASLGPPPEPRPDGPAIAALRSELASLPAAAALATRATDIMPQMDRIKALAQTVADRAVASLERYGRSTMAAKGLDYDQIKAAAAAGAPKSLQEAMDRVDAQIDKALANAPPATRETLLKAKLAPHKAVADAATADLAALQAHAKSAIGHVMPAAPLPSPAEAARRTAEAATLLQTGGSALRANFSGLDLSGFDFGGRDLSEADFAQCRLIGAKFTGANLYRTNFAASDLTEARFDGAALTETNLGCARLDRTDFTGAALAKATLSEAEGEATVFAAATLDGVAAMKVKLAAPSFAGATLNKVKFLDAELDDAIFDEATINRVLLLNCRANRASFRGAAMVRPTIVKSVLHGADFSGATIERLSTASGVDLTHACFDRTKMPAANLIGAELSGSSWVAANAAGALFAQARLRDAVFDCALLQGALLMRSDLGCAQFDGSDCGGASFIKADLRRSSLRRVSLYGADLTDALLDEAVIDGALIDKTVLAGRNFPA